MEIIIPSNKTLEFKEALIFTLFDILKLREETNILSSVTGSKKSRNSGKTYSF
jgi:anhydro-N-acetylmuramic acid kinase